MATNEHIIKAPGMLKNLAVGGHLTTADQVLDDAIGKEQSQINAETATAITNEVSRAEAAEELLRQAYEALTQSDIVVGALPASGEVATIYRVPGESSYKDYMWDGTQFVEMAEYNNVIDDALDRDSDNLVKNKAVTLALQDSIVKQPFIKEFLSTAEYKPYPIAYDLNGDVYETDYRQTTDYYEVSEGMEVLLRLVGVGASLYQLVAFDANKEVVTSACIQERGDTPTYMVYVVPEGIKYLRFTFGNSINTCKVRFVVGSYSDTNSNSGDVWECFDESYPDDVESIYIPNEIPDAAMAFLFEAPKQTGDTNRIIFTIVDDERNELAKSETKNISIKDGEVVTLYCTDAEDDSLIGTPIAYVVFRNHAHFVETELQTTTPARYDMINYKRALNPINFPKLSELNSLSYYKLEYPTKITADYLDQDQYIDEVYVAKKASDDHKIIVRFPGMDRVCLNDCLSVGGNNYVTFSCITYMTNYSDGQVIPMKVTTTNDSENYPLGTLIGYIIVKDKAHAGSVGDTTNNKNYVLNKDYIYQLMNSPKIAAYISNIDNPSASPSGEGYIDIVLPSTIYAVESDTLQLFHKSVVKAANPYNYNINVLCGIGKLYPRYFKLATTNAQLGNQYSLTYRVTNNNNSILAEKEVNLRVLPKMTSPASAKNILLLGASNLAYGQVITELNRRIKLTSGAGTPADPKGLGLSNINFVGRKEVNGLHLEAYGGYSWMTYTTDAYKYIRYYVSGIDRLNIGDKYYINGVAISTTYYMEIIEINVTGSTGNILCSVNGGYVYNPSTIPASGTLIKQEGSGDSTIAYSSYEMEDGNPFWNQEMAGDVKVDTQMYSDNYLGGASIDVIISMLGINRIHNYTSELDYAKEFMRKYHEQYPDGFFILGTIMPTNSRGPLGMTNNFTYYQGVVDRWHYNQGLMEIANDDEFSSYVRIMDLSAEFDSEYSYPYENTDVNNRVTTYKELIGTNSQHPSDAGYRQMADAFFRAITAISKEWE